MPTLDDIQKMAGVEPGIATTTDEGYTPIGFEDLITLRDMPRAVLKIFFKVGRMSPGEFRDPDENNADDFAITDDQLMEWAEAAQDHSPQDEWKVSTTIREYRELRQELEMIKLRRRYILDLCLASIGIENHDFRDAERNLFHSLHLRPSTFPS